MLGACGSNRSFGRKTCSVRSNFESTTVSVEPLTHPVDRSGLHDSLKEIGASQEEFHQFFSGMFDQLDALSARLQKRAGALDQREAELAESRSELSQAREELRRQREELNTVRNEVSQPQPDPRLQEQLGRMEKERAVLDQERLVVETELETVRNRAAELTEALAEQKRQAADERVRWANELKRMHRLMETLSQQQVEYQRVSEARRPNGQPPPRESSEPMQPVSATAAPNDPVLNSVMAQFEMLQKDLARRRRNGCDSKPST